MREIQNETRVIEKFQLHDVHENVIEIMSHGWLAKSESYYIDMELCAFSLREFLLWNIRAKLERRYLDTCVHPDEVDSLSFWTILTHIARGVSFIHSKEECHRDLKPENGNDCFIIKCS